jgi:hypothetical protein
MRREQQIKNAYLEYIFHELKYIEVTVLIRIDYWLGPLFRFSHLYSLHYLHIP